MAPLNIPSRNGVLLPSTIGPPLIGAATSGPLRTGVPSVAIGTGVPGPAGIGFGGLGTTGADPGTGMVGTGAEPPPDCGNGNAESTANWSDSSATGCVAGIGCSVTISGAGGAVGPVAGLVPRFGVGAAY